MKDRSLSNWQNFSLDDIEYVMREASGECYDFKIKQIMSEFFGGEDYNTTSDTYGLYEINKRLAIIDKFFEHNKWKKEEDFRLTSSGKNISEMRSLEYEKGKYMKVYENAHVLFSKGKSKRAILQISNHGMGTYCLYIYSNLDSIKIQEDINSFCKNNNIYKNKKITPSCIFLDFDKEISWDDVILSDSKKDVIKNNVNDMEIYREILRKNNINLKRGIILSGPPGTGKTMICKNIIREAACSVLYVLPSDVRNSEEMSIICKMTADLSPCVLVIEDIDWLGQDREMSANPGIAMELMNHLDGVESFGDIITIATTNSIDTVESAIKNRPGRFDRIIHVDFPDKNNISKMLKTFTKRFIVNEDIDWDLLSDELDGEEMSGSHIKDLCVTAAMFAVRDMSYDENEIIILKEEHFESAFKEISNKDYSTFFKEKSKMGFGTEAEIPRTISGKRRGRY